MLKYDETTNNKVNLGELLRRNWNLLWCITSFIHRPLNDVRKALNRCLSSCQLSRQLVLVLRIKQHHYRLSWCDPKFHHPLREICTILLVIKLLLIDANHDGWLEVLSKLSCYKAGITSCTCHHNVQTTRLPASVLFYSPHFYLTFLWVFYVNLPKGDLEMTNLFTFELFRPWTKAIWVMINSYL